MNHQSNTNRWNNYTKANKHKFNPKKRLEMWNNMTDAQKNKYGEPATKKQRTNIRCDGQKNKYGEPATKKQRTNIRCCLSKFTALVEQFNLDKCVELNDSPFRFLFTLKGYKLNSDLVKELATGFNIDEKSLSIDGRRYKLTLKDFDRILKIGDKDITQDKTHAGPSSSAFDRTRFLVRSGKEEYVCMKLLRLMLERKEENVDDFKRAFALICLRYVVCAPSRGKVGRKFLKYVEDVDNLRNQPWAGLAMSNLVNGIKTFKIPKADGYRDLGGSMVFLQLYHASKLTNKESGEFITERSISPVKFDERDVPANDKWKNLRSKKGQCTENEAAKQHLTNCFYYARMVSKKVEPRDTSSDEDIVQEVLGDRRGSTLGVGQKLPKSVCARASSSSAKRKYSADDVRRMLREYTAPIFRKLNMTPPPIPFPGHVDPQEEDDDDGDGDDNEVARENGD